MEIKIQAGELVLTPAMGGVIVKKMPTPVDNGRVVDPPHVFTDHDALCRFLYTYFVDTEAELKKRAEDA